jgi:hypothetical protein
MNHAEHAGTTVLVVRLAIWARLAHWIHDDQRLRGFIESKEPRRIQDNSRSGKVKGKAEVIQEAQHERTKVQSLVVRRNP